MLESILSSLIVAFVSALTFVAYKHPATYHRNVYLLRTIVLFAVIMILIWDIAIMEAEQNAIQAFGLESYVEKSKIREAMNHLHVPLFPVSYGTLSALAFLYFLDCLPRILGLPASRPVDKAAPPATPDNRNQT